MIVIGLILSVFGVGYLCWLLFTLAVYALPLFAGMTAGLAAYHSGAGLGALVVGFAAGAVTLVAGQAAFAAVKSPVLRVVIAILFAAPAAIAGYHATLGACPNRRALDGLARSVRYCRRDVRRWNGVRSNGGDGHLARYRTTSRRGAGSAADDDRDKPAVKQRRSVVIGFKRMGVFRWLVRPTIERRGLERALTISALLPGRTIERQGGGHRCAAFWSGCEASLL